MSSSSENHNVVRKTINVQPTVEALSTLHDRLSDLDHFIPQNGSKEELSKMGHQFEKLRRELGYLKAGFSQLDIVGVQVSHQLGHLKNSVDDVFESMKVAFASGSVSAEQIQPKLRSLTNSITKLKILLPSVRLVPSLTSHTDRTSGNGNGVYASNDISAVYISGKYECSSIVKEFVDVFEDLDDGARRLLLFFAVFPVGAVVGKRILKNWWHGEGLLELSSVDAEKKANQIFEEMMVRCLIEPVREKYRLIGFKMQPFIHFVMGMHAKENGLFDFDTSDGTPTLQLPGSTRGCLVRNGEKSSLNKLASAQDADLGLLYTLFNVNDPYPDFKLELFYKLISMKVLSLGRWGSSGSHHIEIESTEFLNGLKKMKGLRLFSLRGISRVSNLPDTLCKVSNLRILDLNACHNLEALPDGIGSLKKLIYLDISACYLLDSMPKGLALLTELRVLKGFLIVDDTKDSCPFVDLSGLKKLNKLSVNANRKDFPGHAELLTLQKFEFLKKLSISWGGRAVLERPENKSMQDHSPGNLVEAVKVDLQNQTTAPRSGIEDNSINVTDDQKKVYVHAAKEKSSDMQSEGDVENMKGGAYPGEIIEEDGVGNEGHSEELSKIVDAGNRVERRDGAVEAATGRTQDGTDQGNVVAQAKAITKRVDEAPDRMQEGRELEQRSKGTPTRPAGIRKLLSKLPTLKQQRESNDTTQELFKALQKLDLQCYPEEMAPSWLLPGKMKSLQKLYIRGGKLHTLGAIVENDAWTVEMLRLKFLNELEFNWSDLQTMFPKLTYLEKVDCKKLTSFPCDQNGLWISKTES